MVEFVEFVPAIFVAVAAMLVCLTRMEQNLNAGPRPAAVRAPTRRAVAAAAARAWARGRRARPASSPLVGAAGEEAASVDA